MSLSRVCTLSCALVAVNTLAGPNLAEVEKNLGVEWMGVYMHGKKAGYAKAVGEKSSFKGVPTYRFAMDLTVKVAMLGTEQEIRMQEEKHFDHQGKMRYVVSSMSSAVNGRVLTKTQTVGVVKGPKMVLTTKSAGSPMTQTIDAPKETLDDYLAANRLVAEGAKVGDSVAVHIFEPSLRRSIDATMTVKGKKTILFNGIDTAVTEVVTFMKQMGVSSTSYYNADGRMLETQVGGMFVLRAESENLAKDVKAAFDALRSSVIPVPKPIKNQHGLKEMTVIITGATNPGVILDTPRNTYTKLGPGRYRLTTRVEDVSDLPGLTLPVTDPRLANDLKATALLQSDHPKLRAKAKEIVGNTKDAWQAAQKIRSYVYRNVRKVGTAALSNALETLATMQGDCTEHTALFVGLCRAAGIPARPCTGLVYWPSGNGFGYHQWGMVYVGKWVEVDPTFNQPVADATHIKLADGDLAESARLVGVISTLKVEVVETK